MTAFHPDPVADGLLRHMLLDHSTEPNDFAMKNRQEVVAFHDGQHGYVGAWRDHDVELVAQVEG